jgi:drug/metabolite transporter (DMT)-like permease
MPHEKAVGAISLVLGTAAGSTFNGFAKVLGTALSPLSLIFVSETLNSFFIFFSFGFLPTIRRVLSLKMHQVLPLLCMGLLGGIVAPTLWFTGIGLTSAVNASLFGKVDIIFVMLMAHFVLRERIERRHLYAITCIFCGLLFVSLKGFSQGLTMPAIGDLFFILAALASASSDIIFRKFLGTIEPFIPTLTRCIVALSMFFILSAFMEHRLIDELRQFPLELIPPLIGFAFVSRFLNSVLFFQAVELVPIMTVSMFGTLTIVGGSIFAYFYVGEAIMWYHVAGGLFLILGNILLAMFHTPVSQDQVLSRLQQRH